MSRVHWSPSRLFHFCWCVTTELQKKQIIRFGLWFWTLWPWAINSQITPALMMKGLWEREKSFSQRTVIYISASNLLSLLSFLCLITLWKGLVLGLTTCMWTTCRFCKYSYRDVSGGLALRCTCVQVYCSLSWCCVGVFAHALFLISFKIQDWYWCFAFILGYSHHTRTCTHTGLVLVLVHMYWGISHNTHRKT